MQWPLILSDLSRLDLIALGIFLASWLGIGWFTEHPPAGRPSVSRLMQDYRREWMVQFVTRQPRIFDATIVDSLRQGISFLVSACLIAVGGGVALIGNADQLQGLATDLSLSAAALTQVKLLLVILFVTNAMLKLVWAHRLFGYCAILMASVPNDPSDPAALPRARQAAEINIHGARNFNKGLRSIYFGLGALGWLLGPMGLIAATMATLYVTWRREFASWSREVLLGKDNAAVYNRAD
jgi:uncharacterized membrane protein